MKQKVKLIIFYHPVSEIDADGNYVDNTQTEYLDAFTNACNEYGIVFVDMTNDFRKMYERDAVLPHGFNNTAIGTGHLNKYGHETIAQRLAYVINTMEVE